MAKWENDNELFNIIRKELYTEVVGDTPTQALPDPQQTSR